MNSDSNRKSVSFSGSPFSSRFSPPPGHEPIVSALRQKQYRTAERLALDLLQSSPLSAQLWCWLGEALLHQGFGKAARRVFDRAWLLDPFAAWTETAYRALERTPPGADRPDIEELLAVPETKVTAAVLVRDEKERIVRCLNSLLAAVDEIVVIDTGSCDGTVDQVRALFPGVKLVEIGWDNDFAAARNAGLKHCSGEWVLWVDADEYLHPDDVPNVRTAAGLFRGHAPAALLCIGQINELRKGDARTNYSMVRMFETDRPFRFFGRVHEQVEYAGESAYGNANGSAAGSAAGASVEAASAAENTAGSTAGAAVHLSVRIRVFHDGYAPEVMRDKNKWQRNIELLKQSIAEDSENPAWWFFLARETMGLGDRELALDFFRTAERLAEREPAFARKTEMYMHMAGICSAGQDWTAAEQYCRKALALEPEYPDAHFLLAQIRLRQSAELMREAEQCVRRARESAAVYRGAAPADDGIPRWKAGSMLGDLALRSGNLAQAKALYAALHRRNPDTPGIREKLAYIEGQRRQLNADGSP
jgi:tetratricopeptide (TPR) repeat protein